MRPTIQIDRRMLEDVQNRLGHFQNKAPQVISSALNRALTNVTSNISKETRQKYNIKAADIKSTLEKTRASKTSLNAIVRSRGSLIPLDRFKVSPRKVTPKRKASIKIGVKKNGMKTLSGAFVADINGLKVFRREGRKRLPIDRLFGPSVPQMLKSEEIRERINREGQDTFYRRLDHEIDRLLNGGAAS
ncbi:phage tail protein [Domibacillus aminovorans]|uniref:phage tail protein n=1 Tax=Domibacillus aminovorans TaxID=29332 RepID=UPI003D1EF961